MGAASALLLVSCLVGAVLIASSEHNMGMAGERRVELGGTREDIAKLRAYVHAEEKAKALQGQHIMTEPYVPQKNIVQSPNGPEPSGFIVQPAKFIHGILDVAAPLDPGTEATVPGIIKPEAGTLPYRRAFVYGQHLTGPAEVDQTYDPTEIALGAAHAAAAAGYMQAALPQQLAQTVGRQQQLTETWQLDPDGTQVVVPPHVFAQDPRDIRAPLPMLPPPLAPVPGVYPQAPVVLPSMAPNAPAVAYPSRGVPNMFRAPFREWSNEDAAEHAYNLAEWRAKILEAKLLQAKLRQELLAEASARAPPHVPAQSGEGMEGPRSWVSSGRRGLRGRRGGTREALLKKMQAMRKEDKAQLGAVQKQVLSLAKETTKALDTLSGRIKCLSTGCGAGPQRQAERSSARQRAVYATQGQLAQMEKQVGSEYGVIERRLASLSAGEGRGGSEHGQGLQGGVEGQEKLWESIAGRG